MCGQLSARGSLRSEIRPALAMLRSRSRVRSWFALGAPAGMLHAPPMAEAGAKGPPGAAGNPLSRPAPFTLRDVFHTFYITPLLSRVPFVDSRAKARRRQIQ